MCSGRLFENNLLGIYGKAELQSDRKWQRKKAQLQSVTVLQEKRNDRNTIWAWYQALAPTLSYRARHWPIFADSVNEDELSWNRSSVRDRNFGISAARDEALKTLAGLTCLYYLKSLIRKLRFTGWWCSINKSEIIKINELGTVQTASVIRYNWKTDVCWVWSQEIYVNSSSLWKLEELVLDRATFEVKERI